GSDFANNLLNLVQLLFLFGVVLLYHLNILRADGTSAADALSEKQSGYSVLILDSGNGFADSVKAALMKLGSNVQVMTASPSERPQGSFNAIILNGSLSVDAPEWVRSFGGSKIIVQNDAENLVWTDDAAQAAQSVRQLAEGEEVRIQKVSRSGWIYVIYVFAALFVLQLMFILLAVGISFVTGF
ncbi:MAG TPA: hypothetical protein VKE92_12465, partial [Anaerolineales bacterium]|nr:hypothetical protein [Anaerolineales bacterium]